LLFAATDRAAWETLKDAQMEAKLLATVQSFYQGWAQVWVPKYNPNGSGQLVKRALLVRCVLYFFESIIYLVILFILFFVFV